MALAWDEHGTGEPVVCLHGFGLDRSVMAAAMEPVLGLRPGLRRIYPDLPGHGESPAGPPDPAGVADAVSTFIDGPLGGGPVLLAGWSYGGYIAATLARRRPASVTGLLLICAGARLLAPGERELPGPPADPGPGPWLDRVPGGLREHLGLAIGNRSAEVAGRVAAALTAARPGDEEYLERLRAAGYQAPDEDDTAGYPGPACILAGRQDRIGGYADQFRALSAFPAASYSVLPQAGHYLPFEQPAAFGALVLEWLDNRVAPVLARRPGDSVRR